MTEKTEATILVLRLRGQREEACWHLTPEAAIDFTVKITLWDSDWAHFDAHDIDGIKHAVYIRCSEIVSFTMEEVEDVLYPEPVL